MPSQKLLDQLEIICHRNKQVARRQELFDVDPTCKVCTAAIEHVEDCAPVKMADGSEFLCHTACSMAMYQSMATRYFGRGLV